MTALVVLAKAPVAGRVKTRLCPPCTPDQAASLAAAALADTIGAVAATPTDRRVLVVEGDLDGLVDVPEGFDVLPQRGAGLDERLAAAFEDVGEPAVLVGMDTPQVTPQLLADGLRELDAGADAVFGPADDGGYWVIGLQAAEPRAFLGVPMSASSTGAEQLRRLRQLGQRVVTLPGLRDVDGWDDAVAVAEDAPGTRFAAAVSAIAPNAEAALAHR